MISVKEQKCLFILSGEHETLPNAELCASLEAEGYPYTIQDHKNRITLMEVHPQGAIKAIKRTALVNSASIVQFTTSMDEREILRAIRDVDMKKWLKENSRFGVKVTRVKRETSAIDVEELQRKIGSQIWKGMNSKVKVDLTAPEVLFLGVIHGNSFYFGPFLGARDREGFFQRRSPLRPFFVPSAIHPKIARVMVNLSRAAPGDILLDPFCGTGGLLLEAAGIGCLPLGLDIDSLILAGCQQNLTHYQIPFYGVNSDARTPPFFPERIDVIATDPPYGRSSSTMGNEVTSLIKSSLFPLADLIKRKGFLCFALPLKSFHEELIPKKEFSIVESHTMRIHRSLYRHILVLKRR